MEARPLVSRRHVSACSINVSWGAALGLRQEATLGIQGRFQATIGGATHGHAGFLVFQFDPHEGAGGLL